MLLVARPAYTVVDGLRNANRTGQWRDTDTDTDNGSSNETRWFRSL